MTKFLLEADHKIPPYLNAQANKACTRVETLLGVEVKDLLIKVVRTREEMEGKVGQPLHSMTRGIFLTDENTIMIVEPRSPEEAFVLITHELTHLFTSRIPSMDKIGMLPWFFEGLAVYISEQDHLMKSTDMPGLDETALQLAKAEIWINTDPDKSLVWWMSGQASQTEMAAVFAQGYSWIKWLVTTTSQESIRTIYMALVQGESFQEALRVLTGRDLDTLMADWRRYITAGLKQI